MVIVLFMISFSLAITLPTIVIVIIATKNLSTIGVAINQWSWSMYKTDTKDEAKRLRAITFARGCQLTDFWESAKNINGEPKMQNNLYYYFSFPATTNLG